MLDPLNLKNFPKALLAVLLLGACPCDKPAAPPPLPKLPAHWLAQVNGEVLLLGDMERELAVGVWGEEEEMAKPSLSPELLLEELIYKTLLLQEAKRQQLFPNEAQVKQHIQVLMAGFLEHMAQAQVDTQGFRMAHLEKITAEQMAIEALLSKEVFERIAITEEELRSFYEDNAELFFAPAEIEASQIVVKTQQEANKLLRLLRAGRSFEKLARQYSIAPEAENGGKLGRFGKNVMPSPLDETLFSMRANEVSNAIPSPFGWHLFWVHKKFRPQRIPFNKVRKSIEARLISEYGTQMKADFLKKLKSQAHIEINHALLAATWPSKRASEETP
ncbi:MAG: peptidyl-prolyl cis-trans isomerase [Cystobacterineae bacterium]|nr:peptidyl-prolyl cis-trans isomerase [Cystobacterineae bacterium]